MGVTYEFVVEQLDRSAGSSSEPDIIDTSAFDTLAEATSFARSCNEPSRIALRRDVGNDLDGLTDRCYAYPDGDGWLPERFETADGLQDGPAVPARFRRVRIAQAEGRT